MATIVCQGLQSCLESQLIESTTLRLKLSSPKPLFSNSLEIALNSNYNSESHQFKGQKPDNGGWSFLQDLSNPRIQEQNVYVHPMAKRYSSKLSEKSLLLCTESLGSETGSDISPDNSFLFESPISSPKSEEEIVRKSDSVPNSTSPLKRNLNLNRRRDREAVDRSFPPPLTTMSRAEPLQVRSRREGGRLIITAAAAPAASSCFKAERSGGRLRLSFAGESDFSDDEIEEEAEEDDEEEEENAGNDSCEGEEETEENWDTEGNSSKVGGEIGKDQFAIRRRRCKEGEIEKNGLLKWEPFWVAT